MNRVWRTATVLWMAGILIVSLLPGTAATPGGALWHLIGYGVLGALWGRWQPAWAAWLLATGYGALIEGIQWFVPYRLAEAGDLLTNALGAVVGVLVSRARLRRRSIR